MKNWFMITSDQISTLFKKILPTVKTIWKSYGYYISLVCLLTVFGITAYMYRTDKPDSDLSKNVYENNGAYVEAMSMLSATAEPTPSPAPYSPSFIMPAAGEITNGFDLDELQWNDTLGQWMLHNGIDIKAIAGTVVSASESGTIAAVYEDAMYGITIEISHPDGWTTRYSSLETMNLVETGQQISKGEVISSVGTSALAECNSGSHVHFELLKNGEYVEPTFE